MLKADVGLPIVPLAPEQTRHAALEGDIDFTPDEWLNVNRRIMKTVNTILPYGYVIEGPGPREYELHSHLGVALVAEIYIRPIRRSCSLANPKLQEKIRDMASDTTHLPFRHTYLHGRVWFFFRVINPEMARQPLSDDELEELTGTSGPVTLEDIEY
ncbi:hypothetical protein SAMD00023353_6600360 [Rosellinia necatrix]|uniref:Uncharacterized protein n=1 Tax=Rosellinia necatrix TaxID=77044 RepID=A0A1S8AAD1_ROSNE|nr:hypothetical protein SAMD00023353_6600360 [Rosellinia necatrix]